MTRKTRQERKAKQRIRCAIYTRKSTEEGLDQEFNSLDAQREAGEAFVESQRHEGWVCLPDRYDDGGFSGGNMDRPALKRLLADVEAGKIECIVVYKVDRLSRSLLDFARIMETLDKQHVSFVSVTQQFNTTHSMGRLTLNILLSFAQFEREIIAERTSDKMSAARRKGRWVGGRPVLGYDIAPEGGRLVVNEGEAARIRAIFEIYIERQSLIATVKELNRRGWTTKRWITRKGRESGGRPFTKDTLFRLLTNPIYLGKVRHKGNLYEGAHDAVVNEVIWLRAGELLRRNGRTGGKTVRNKYGALLKGILYCEPCGAAMVHAYTSRGTKRYRYYVCGRAQKQGWDSCPTKSLPAGEIERFVVDRIRCIGSDPQLAAEAFKQAQEENRRRLAELEREKRGLEADLKRYATRVRRLIKEIGPGASANSPQTAELASLQERMRLAEQRATEVRNEIIAKGMELVDQRELAAALSIFDPVWESLSPREQARVMQLLVERVGYDGRNGTMSITFRNSGIKTLTQELEEEREEEET
ncbi:MAG: recombinase family protein [Planctomycetes bacterium]|nr:recombinase family protein [Planctomycetota bacterium]